MHLWTGFKRINVSHFSDGTRMVTTERADSFRMNVIAPDLSNLMLMSRFIKTNTTAVWHHQLKNYPEDQTALCMCVLDELNVALAFGFGVTLGSFLFIVQDFV